MTPEELVEYHAWYASRYSDRVEAARLRQENERLKTGLLGHACYCGSSDLNPSVHREDCAYRKWASPEHPRADEPT